jgi:hypothetical protein
MVVVLPVDASIVANQKRASTNSNEPITLAVHSKLPTVGG